MQKPPKNTDGFSLIELSIVMAVMSVMATAMVPNMLAQHQEKLVEATVDGYYHIADAAKAYEMDKGFWPGFQEAEGGDCAPILSGETGLQVLFNEGYIHTPTMANPWQNGGAQAFQVQAKAYPVGCSGDCERCDLELVSDNIPASAQNMLTKLLPAATCDAAGSCTALMSAEPGAGGGGGAAMPAGGVMMFEDGCPAGWAEVDGLAGRMPVGVGDPGLGSGLDEPYSPRDKGGTIGFKLQGSATMGTRGYVKEDDNFDTEGDPHGELRCASGGADSEYCRTQMLDPPVGVLPSAFDQLNLNALQWQEDAFGLPRFEEKQVNEGSWLKGEFTDGAPDGALATNFLNIIPPYYAVSFCKAP
ncbi:MAG: hypothetical protein CMH60_05015 [Myxococcales bacterium]|nr:hypothetical protein [Myxococcales bacterium]